MGIVWTSSLWLQRTKYTWIELIDWRPLSFGQCQPSSNWSRCMVVLLTGRACGTFQPGETNWRVKFVHFFLCTVRINVSMCVWSARRQQIFLLTDGANMCASSGTSTQWVTVRLWEEGENLRTVGQIQAAAVESHIIITITFSLKEIIEKQLGTLLFLRLS